MLVDPPVRNGCRRYISSSGVRRLGFSYRSDEQRRNEGECVGRSPLKGRSREDDGK